MKYAERTRAAWLMSACMAAIVWSSPALAQDVSGSAEVAGGEAAPEAGEIIVTARKRGESLLSVPVAVSALSAQDISRYKADDLTKIGELTPTVIVGANKANGGGSIAIRGISSPGNTAGFEQAVSVAIDGIQTSNGRIAQLGFFDVAQVEVLKGPQALFFGKNSPAGVISIKTAMPTADLEVSGKATYEFMADEITTEAAISGPLSDTLGVRLAVRYRHSEGWLYNDARERPNPFFLASLPAAVAQLPGATDSRVGDEDYQARLTLAYDPGNDFSAILKIFGYHGTDAGSGVASQVVGCPGPVPVTGGVADSAAECRADNHTSNSDFIPAISQTMPRGNDSGQAFGRLTAWTASLALSKTAGDVTIASTTGFNSIKSNAQFGFDQSAFSQLAVVEQPRIREISQELRLSTKFDLPLNFVVGAYYQNVRNTQYNDVKFSDRAYSAVSGRFDNVESQGKQTGRTISVFGQAIYNITDQIEAAAGARWSNERKNLFVHSLYGLGAFNTLNTAYPGSTRIGELQGRFRDTNVSPEATLTYRPDRDHTLYIAYKTGYKSGGFTIAPIQTTTTIGDQDFGPERVRGFEVGAKGLFVHRRLRLTATMFDYTFRGQQVSVYDPTQFRFIVDNAGKVRQRGVEADFNFQIDPVVGIHGAVAYVHNRFEDFVGQCYAFSFPAGTTPSTAVPPANCSLVPGGGLTLQQVYNGRAPARSPDLSGNAGITLAAPIGDWNAEFTGDAFYSSRYYASDNLNPGSRQDAFWRFNASVTIRSPEDRWAIALIGRNLTNENYLLFAADRTGGASVPGVRSDVRATVSRGREVALQLSTKF